MSEESAKSNNKNGTDAPKINEPSEVDPCIDFKNSSNKPKLLENVERRVREKTGLTQFGYYVGLVILLTLVVLLIIVVVLGITWPRIPHHLQFPICGSPSCLRAAAQVQESWNSSASPCDSVWKWACDGWLRKNSLPPDRSKWSIHEEVKRQESARIHDYISTLELPLHLQTVEWKMKYLYEGCLDVDNINVDKETPLVRIISELGGWSILRNWNIQNFDRNLVIKQLHVKYGVSPYFRVSVQPNPRLPGSYSITISPSGLGLPDKYYYYTPQNDPVQIAYKQMIRDVVILFSQYTKSDAQKFGEDMFSYEKRIAEITPSLHESINFVNTYNPVKISELKLTVSSLPLQDILTAMFPEFNVTEETEVIVTSLYYLTEVARVATSTDSKTLSDYIIWTLVREYLPYLSTEYTSTLSLFRGEIFGFRQAHPRWEKCTSLVQNVMGFAIGSALEYNHPIKATTEMLVETIFEETRSAVHEKLSKMEISSSFNKFLSNKLAKLQLQVGFPNNAATYQKYLKEYYSKLMILKGSLFESIKHSLFFKRRVEERLLKSPQVNDQLLSRLVEEPDKVGYVPSLNTVVVPRMLLTEPLFDEKFPSSILYGRLGVSMAEAVISSILPYDNMWTADLKLLSPFHLTVNESYAIIVNAKYCLENFLEHATIASKSDPELVTLSTLKHLFAVNIAHEALRNFKKDTKHVHHPSLEKLEDSALFFLTYSQMQCSVSATQQDIYDNVVNYKLSQKSLLEASWTHLPEFPTSLECKNVNKIQCNNIF
ncbi:hypothetical protein FQA39_LY16403 [Lamprigera yunnana]|nr:hypothetical protein FQA39_LY16403 [Lamprigera yunnana]